MPANAERPLGVQILRYGARMGWVRRLYGMDKPVPPEVVPEDRVVHVATLPLWQAPLIVIGLEQQGINATFAEVSSPRAALSGRINARVFVVERDRIAAEEVIADLTTC
ncbi:MAG: hypothetical protein JWN62_3569 [Acidimicrobiales bacterium]|nr:hypothetical protein [Acidimicrobiales bacterium]